MSRSTSSAAFIIDSSTSLNRKLGTGANGAARLAVLTALALACLLLPAASVHAQNSNRATATGGATSWVMTPVQSGVVSVRALSDAALAAGAPLGMPSMLPRVSQALAGRGGPSQAGGGFTQSNPNLPFTASAGLSFDGIGSGVDGLAVSYIPATGTAAAGTTQIVETANQYFAVYYKPNGAIFPGFPKSLSALFSTVSGCSTATLWNPVVLFDHLAQRWLIAAAVTSSATPSASSSECVAISQTADATGEWNVYQYSSPSAAAYYFDSPKVALWRDAYSFTYNLWSSGTSTAIFEGVAICGLDRNALLAGDPASQVCTQTGNSYDANLIPVTLDGANYPASGAKELYFETAQGIGAPGSYGQIYMYRAAFNFAARTVTLDPVVSIPVRPYNTLACAAGSSGTSWPYCAPQAPHTGACYLQNKEAVCGTQENLDTFAGAMGYRASYRNFGGYESVVLTTPVSDGGNTNTADRWWEIRSPYTAPVDYQDSTYSPDASLYRFDGSIGQDHMGDMLLGYTGSGSAVFPSIYVTGRKAGDSPNLMEEESRTFAGLNSRVNVGDGTYPYSWGNMSSVAVDPDDCTFWYTNEYLPTAGMFNWRTRIASYSFGACSDAASITLPIPATAGGAPLKGTTATFYWTPGSGTPTSYILQAGGSRGGSDYCKAETYLAGNYQAPLSCIPQSAGTFWVRLTTVGGANTYQDYQYTVGGSTATAVTSSKNPAKVGEAVTFTATVSAAAIRGTDTVTFTSDGEVLCGGTVLPASGVASCTTSTLPKGTHAIIATYNGSTAAVPSPVLAQKVVSLLGAASTTYLSCSPNPAASGTSVACTATVTPTSGSTPTPTGTITWTALTGCSTTALNANGSASCSSTTLGAGADTIGATYGGDSNYAAATEVTVTEYVQQDPATVTCSTTGGTWYTGTPVTITSSATTTGYPSPTVSWAVFPTLGSCTGTPTALTSGVAGTSYTGLTSPTKAANNTQCYQVTYTNPSDGTAVSGTCSLTVLAAPTTSNIVFYPNVPSSTATATVPVYAAVNVSLVTNEGFGVPGAKFSDTASTPNTCTPENGLQAAATATGGSCLVTTFTDPVDSTGGCSLVTINSDGGTYTATSGNFGTSTAATVGDGGRCVGSGYRTSMGTPTINAATGTYPTPTTVTATLTLPSTTTSNPLNGLWQVLDIGNSGSRYYPVASQTTSGQVWNGATPSTYTWTSPSFTPQPGFHSYQVVFNGDTTDTHKYGGDISTAALTQVIGPQPISGTIVATPVSPSTYGTSVAFSIGSIVTDAVGSIMTTGAATAGDTVTIGSTVYTFESAPGSCPPAATGPCVWVGGNASNAAHALEAAINNTQSQCNGTAPAFTDTCYQNPATASGDPDVSAIIYSGALTAIGLGATGYTVLGSAGNNVALLTSDAGVFTLSGTKLSGGGTSTTAPTGSTVSFYDTFSGVTTELCAGVALATGSCTAPATQGGANTILAVYNVPTVPAGMAPISALAYTVNPVATSTNLSCTPNFETYGSTVTCTAAITPAVGSNPYLMAPTGTVTFAGVVLTGDASCGTNGVVTLSGSNVATCILPSTITTARKSLTATYSGDSNYATSVGAYSQIVLNQTPTVTLNSVTPSSGTYGSAATTTVQATLAWTGSGTAPATACATAMTFASTATGSYGTPTLVSSSANSLVCSAVFTPGTANAVGTYTMSASFTASGSYNGASSTATNNFTINQFALSPPTVPGVSIVYGSTSPTNVVATFTGTGVSGDGAPTGVVTFTAATGTIGGSFSFNQAANCVATGGNGTNLVCTAQYTPSGTLDRSGSPYGAAFSASITAAGNYSASATTNASLTVTKATPIMGISNVSIPYGSTTGVTVTGTATGAGAGAAPTGGFTFTADPSIGGTFSGTPSCSTAGNVKTCTQTYVPSGTLAVGVYSTTTITVSIGTGTNNNYAGATSPDDTVTVTAATPTVTIAPSPVSIAYGSVTPVSVVATFAGSGLSGGAAPSGTVTFTANTGTIGGSFSFSQASNCATGGTNNTSLICTGTYTPSGTLAVGSYPTVSAFSASIAAAGDYGAAGPVGAHLTVTAATPTVAISNVSTTYGSTTGVTVTATITGAGTAGDTAPSGAVTFGFTTGGTAIGGTVGAASCNSSGNVTTCTGTYTPSGTFPVGTYAPPSYNTIMASIALGGNYLAGTSAGDTVTIGAATPTVAITPNPATTSYGSTANVGLTITFTGAGSGDTAPNGIVSFSSVDGMVSTPSCSSSTDVTTCTSTYTPSGTLAPGYYAANFSASITAAGNYNSASGTGDVSVSQGSTTTSVASSQNPSVYGQSVTFTATVSAPNGLFKKGRSIKRGIHSLDVTGTVTWSGWATASTDCPASTVTFVDAGDSTATCTLSDLPVGNSTITATYGGDSNHTGSNGSLAGGQGVTQASSSTSVSSSLNPSTYGQSVSFTATVAAVSPGSGTPMGTVQFNIDGSAFGSPVTLASGSATSGSTSTLTAGTHTVTAVYSGNSDFTSGTGTLSGGQVVTAATAGTSVSSSQNPSVYGQSVTFTASISGEYGLLKRANGIHSRDVTGTVLWSADTGCGTTTVTSGNPGTATCTTSSLPLGNSVITATYSGDSNHSGSTGTLSGGQVVNQASSSTSVSSSLNPSTYGQSVSFTANVAAAAPGVGTPTGTVQFNIDGSAFGSPVTLSSGSATSGSISTLTVGTHTVAAVYSGDTDFTNGTGTLIGGQGVRGGSTTTAVTSGTNPSVYGQSVTFTATISAPNGLVRSKVRSRIHALGVHSEDVTGTVTWSGWATASTDCPASTVTFVDAGDSTATCTLSDLPVGNSTITATYSGDSNHTGSNGSLAGGQEVSKASTTTELGSAPNPSTYGQTVTFTATVAAIAPGAGTPSGTVPVVDTSNGNAAVCTITLAGGTGSCTSSALASGSHNLSGAYSGDANFTTSTGTASQSVTAGITTTALISTPNPSTGGQTVTFTATVSPAPTAGSGLGSVTFKSNGTSIGMVGLTTASNGVAILNYWNLAPGATYNIIAYYSGSAGLSASTSNTVNQTVNLQPTITTVSATPTSSVWGQSVTLTATVAANPSNGATPAGTVAFKNGGTTIGTVSLSPTSGGLAQAVLNISTLPVAANSITANYTGSNVMEASTSAATTVTVSQASSTTTVASSLNPALYGQTITFTATVSPQYGGIATGTVTFYANNSQIGALALNSSGKAVLNISSLTPGTYAVLAKYAGSTNVALSQGTMSPDQAVNQIGTSTSVTPSLTSSVYGQSVTLTATVTQAMGATIPTGSVSFKAGSTTLGAATLNSGVASLTTSSLPTGSDTVTANYLGTGLFSASSGTTAVSVAKTTSTTALTSSPNPSTGGAAVTFTATVTAPYGVVPTGTVTFLNGTTSIGALSLNGSGVATLSYSLLLPGTHSITASYGGSANVGTSTSSAVSQAVTIEPTTTSLSGPSSSSWGQSVTLTATVSAANGASPTGTVTFKRGTTSLGNATLVAAGGGNATATLSTTALPVGSDSVTASYTGSSYLSASVSTALSITVTKSTSTTALTSSPNPSSSGQSVAFTATVTTAYGAVPTGTVTFYNGGVAIGTSTLAAFNASGVATVNYSGLAVGSHSITAAYNGSANSTGSTSSPLTQTVN